MTAEKIYPEMSESLVYDRTNSKVLAVFEARSTTVENGEYGEEIVKLGLIVPKIPEEGGLTTGFEMRLLKIENDKFSTSAKDCVKLSSDDTFDFIVSGAGLQGIYLDQEEGLDVYKEMGMVKTIDSLKRVINRHRTKLTSKNPIQIEWENAALLMAPLLARFFVLTPEEQV